MPRKLQSNSIRKYQIANTNSQTPIHKHQFTNTKSQTNSKYEISKVQNKRMWPAEAVSKPVFTNGVAGVDGHPTWVLKLPLVNLGDGARDAALDAAFVV